MTSRVEAHRNALQRQTCYTVSADMMAQHSKGSHTVASRHYLASAASISSELGAITTSHSASGGPHWSKITGAVRLRPISRAPLDPSTRHAYVHSTFNSQL